VPTLPFVTNWVDPVLWARASRKVVADLVEVSRKDTVIDAHFLYPDAVAAVILARRLRLPVVMTARGSDVNVKCENPLMRRWVRWAATRCAAIITVSQALADRLMTFGVAADNIHVLPNGVDLEKFQPKSGMRFQPEFSAVGTLLLSAGHLLEAKGHHIAIQALTDLPDATLLIVGEGPEESALRTLAQQLGVAPRVRFLGYVPHGQMADIYSAADFTILASANEGMPNVMLESLACGTRVIATNVGGVGEVITDPVAGAIMASRSAGVVLECVRRLGDVRHEPNETRGFAQRFGWADTVQRQISLYERVISG
jgi:glycosyltransferase involved in cell wall biosynthesis